MSYKDDYLLHYGVLGMRWGRRKDITKDKRMTANKFYKKTEKHLKKPRKSKNMRAVQNQIRDELTSTRAFKEGLKYEKKLKAKANSVGVTGTDVLRYNNLMKGVENENRRIIQKYRRAYAGAMLRDLKYKDTKAGRDFVIKWMDEMKDKANG